MISKFSSLYTGHVDLPDMGQMATPARERRYSNEHLATTSTRGLRVPAEPPHVGRAHRSHHAPPSMGTPQAVMLEQLRWFAREVMPKFGAPTR